MEQVIAVHQEVVLGLPTGSHPAAALRANTIVDAVDGNATFSITPAQMDAAKAGVKAYAKAVNDVKNKVPGATNVRREARRAMLRALEPLRTAVQIQVDNHLDQAATLAEEAKMKLRKRGVRTKPDFAVKDGLVSGQVHLFAKAVAGALLYFWELSGDGGKSWTVAFDTHVAGAVISGLSAGQVYSFRFRVRTRKTTTDYSQVVTHMVR